MTTDNKTTSDKQQQEPLTNGSPIEKLFIGIDQEAAEPDGPPSETMIEAAFYLYEDETVIGFARKSFFFNRL